jgi:hypothetical protein
VTALDEVIRSAAGIEAVLARIAERQRDFDAVCRGSIARLMAADRSTAGLLQRLSESPAARWGVAGGGDAG